MTNETIADIVREMRGQGGDDGYPLDIKRYADRIEAATDNRETLHNALEENERLRSALKPVMSCDVIFWEGEDPWYAENRTVKNASYGQVACTTAEFSSDTEKIIRDHYAGKKRIDPRTISIAKM